MIELQFPLSCKASYTFTHSIYTKCT